MKFLIVHIGIGKAGSTAIQNYLRTQRKALAEIAIQYWGINLENIETIPNYQWQRPDGIGHFQRLPVAQAREELGIALRTGVDVIPEGGCAVWSNESIYERPEVYMHELLALTQEKSIEISCIAYARGHRSYIGSAYKQWGVKHKTYHGRIKGFGDWVISRRDFLSYGKKLCAWDDDFKDKFRLINYDFLDDVVKSFVTFLPSAKTVPPVTSNRGVNASPSSAELMLYALHNNQYDEPISPWGMQAFLRRHQQIENQHPVIHFSSMFPGDDEINKAIQLLDEDLQCVDELLLKHGQPIMEAGAGKGNVAHSEQQLTSLLLSTLLSMVRNQDNRIKELENTLESLSRANPLNVSDP